MYGLSTKHDLSFLLGRELIQVCLGRHDAILNLDGASIAIQTDVTFRDQLSPPAHHDAIAEMAHPLLSLINQTIVGASAMPPGTLVVKWSSGSVLEVHDSSQQYESYQIRCGDRLIVV